MGEKMRAANEYDLYLPLRYNDGSPVEPEKLGGVKKQLADRFGGLTFFPQQNEGLWKVGNVTFRDEIVICRIHAEDVGSSRDYFIQLKDELKALFRQEDVLIVERKIEVL